MTVADRMAVFMEGRIVQIGTPKDIYLHPANVAVAGFIGTPPMNLLAAELAQGQVRLHGAALPVAGAPPDRRAVTLGVRPSDLRIADSGMPARVEFIEDLGDNVIVNFDVDGQRLKARSEQHPTLLEGQAVHLSFDPRAAHLFDRETGSRLAPPPQTRQPQVRTE